MYYHMFTLFDTVRMYIGGSEYKGAVNVYEHLYRPAYDSTNNIFIQH